MMSRLFVNLIAKKLIPYHRPAYTLHRINPSTFFFDSAAERSAASDEPELEEFELPPATMTFHGTCSSEPALDFAPFGRGTNKGILALGGNGRTTLCAAASAAAPAISAMPSMHASKHKPIFLIVGDKVYVMDSSPGGRHSFEALIHGRGSMGRSGTDWHWHSLPLPPHVRSPRLYSYEEASVDGHAVVGDSQILISTRFGGRRTYSFDTASASWRAMGWSLPFRGRAEYVPELELWFGISSSRSQSQSQQDEQDNRLCAFDLSASVASAASPAPPPPPVLRGVWEDVPQQQNWELIKSYILPLGNRRLLIAKFFVRTEKIEDRGELIYLNRERFAVLAGVQMVEEEPRASGGLRLVKHRSKRYDHQCTLPDWLI